MPGEISGKRNFSSSLRWPDGPSGEIVAGPYKLETDGESLRQEG
jgi:hypothetical protein